MPFTPVDIPVAELVESYGAHFVWLIIIALAASTFGLMYPGRRLSDSDWLSTLRWNFWHGRLGRLLVRLSGLGAHSRTRATDAHRPTELAIGLAAQDLYDALPRAIQQQFRDLPRIVRRLEDEAQSVRTRVSKLTSTEASVGPSPASGADERARLIADLRSAKQREQERLATTVTALEAIRLDLLRLSAGVGDSASLTRALMAAARLGQQVDASLNPDPTVARTPV
jgi:serine/threonine-protein kinase